MGSKSFCNLLCRLWLAKCWHPLIHRLWWPLRKRDFINASVTWKHTLGNFQCIGLAPSPAFAYLPGVFWPSAVAAQLCLCPELSTTVQVPSTTHYLKSSAISSLVHSWSQSRPVVSSWRPQPSPTLTVSCGLFLSGIAPSLIGQGRGVHLDFIWRSLTRVPKHVAVTAGYTQIPHMKPPLWR